MDEVIGEFLVESYESLDQLDADLLALEADPDSSGTIASIFRTVHTIKGTCGFLGFSTLERVAHVGENLLSRLRDGELRPDAEMTTALLALSDAVRTMLGAIESTGTEGDDDHAELVATLTRLRDREPPTTPQVSKLGEILVARKVATPEQVAAAVARQLAGDTRRLGEILVEQGVSAEKIDDALATQGEFRHAGGSIADTCIRVDVARLDELTALVGRLVVARNDIGTLARRAGDVDLLTAHGRLDRITTELQECAMQTRLQPIGSVWARFPRVVRDLAVACGRRVRIEMEGEDTELDKSVIDAIKDPLTHLVRNAVDHGIEPPERRRAAGKPEEGRLLLRAFHEEGTVGIEIADDGAGMDPDRIRAKAVEQGIVTADHALALTDEEALELVFAPGLSTAETITNVSGRGVGMDVVRTCVDKIGGSVVVRSVVGSGTSFTITIPLTLAIIGETVWYRSTVG